MKYFLTITAILICFGTSRSQEKYGIKSYREVDSLVNIYANTYQFEKAIEILEYAKITFPNYLFRIIDDLASLYMTIDKNDKALVTYEYGLSKNVYYRINPSTLIFIKMYKEPRFSQFLNENNKLYEEARKNTKARYEVALPINYDSLTTYPIFIAMHGYTGNAKGMVKGWKSEKLQKEYIVICLQSSQLVGMNQYSWENIEISRKDLKECYAWVKGRYKIDESKVLIGGISQGGEVSIDAILNDLIPVNGFVAVIPAGHIMKGLDNENIEKAVERKIAGAFILGEKDPVFNHQKEVLGMFQKAGMNIYEKVFPELGHQVPNNISPLLDSALNFFERIKE